MSELPMPNKKKLLQAKRLLSKTHQSINKQQCPFGSKKESSSFTNHNLSSSKLLNWITNFNPSNLNQTPADAQQPKRTYSMVSTINYTRTNQEPSNFQFKFKQTYPSTTPNSSNESLH